MRSYAKNEEQDQSLREKPPDSYFIGVTDIKEKTTVCNPNRRTKQKYKQKYSGGKMSCRTE